MRSRWLPQPGCSAGFIRSWLAASPSPSRGSWYRARLAGRRCQPPSAPVSRRRSTRLRRHRLDRPRLGSGTRACRLAIIAALSLAAILLHLAGYNPFDDTACARLCVDVPPVASDVVSTRVAITSSQALSAAASLILVVSILWSRRSRPLPVTAGGVLAAAALAVAAARRWMNVGEAPCRPPGAAAVGHRGRGDRLDGLRGRGESVAERGRTRATRRPSGRTPGSLVRPPGARGPRRRPRRRTMGRPRRARRVR